MRMRHLRGLLATVSQRASARTAASCRYPIQAPLPHWPSNAALLMHASVVLHSLSCVAVHVLTLWEKKARPGMLQGLQISVSGLLRVLCCHLQGPGTDKAPLAELRNATRLGRSCVVQLVNYRRNGDAFVNYLSVTPIHNDAGMLTHYVGIQSDITELVNHKKAELAAKHAAVQVMFTNSMSSVCSMC